MEVKDEDDVFCAKLIYAKKDEIVWLPRQDQLQEMMGDYKVCLDIIQFKEYIRPIYESFEQFWLSVVMQEKHNKTWDGERWRAKQ